MWSDMGVKARFYRMGYCDGAIDKERWHLRKAGGINQGIQE